ncbi:hypothetical protein MC885_020498 [Smutsia gigantea]|nr:hypothetical protein MC885_020498 [Smutsia gigantea]
MAAINPWASWALCPQDSAWCVEENPEERRRVTGLPTAPVQYSGPMQVDAACELCASGRGNKDKLEPCPEELPVPFPGWFIQLLRLPSPLVLHTWLRTPEA